MPIDLIGKVVRDKVETLLSDVDQGFNAIYEENLASFGLTSSLNIDFSGSSGNFFKSQVDTRRIEQTSCFSYPLMILYVKMSYNRGHQKFNVFSGDVSVFIEIWHSWDGSSAPQNTEKYLDADEAVVVHIFNSVANQGIWALGTVYNGDVRCERTPLRTGGQSWVQGLIVRLDMQTHTG